MRLVKMSLLAATLITSSVFAIDNVKVDGDTKLFYSTADGQEIDLFNKNSATGEAALRLGVTADLTEGISAGATLYAVSTLGLYNNLVGATWTGGLNDNFWFGEAWLAGTYGKTTGKIGRMTLDTPMVFTETWSIVPNTFEAAVLINEDIPNTTLVGAYVGQSNDGVIGGGITDNAISGDAQNNLYSSFYQGAYTVGVVNNSWEPLTVQAWYYQAQHLLSAYWVQGDLNIVGLDFGLQATGTTETAALSDESNSAFAGKIGYEMKDTFTVSGAFSQTGDKATTTSVGANLGGSGQSKLYTEAWWNYGYITRNDTSAFNVSATTPEQLTWAQLGVYFTQSTSKDAFTGAQGKEDLTMTEVTVEAAKSFGALDVGLYYIMTKADDLNQDKPVKKGDAFNTVQAYLTYNF